MIFRRGAVAKTKGGPELKTKGCPSSFLFIFIFIFYFLKILGAKFFFFLGPKGA